MSIAITAAVARPRIIDPHDSIGNHCGMNSPQSLSSSFVCHWRKPIDLCRHDESLKRGVFRSVDDLESAITRYIAAHKQEPQALPLDRDRKNHPGQAHAEPSV
jgi:hypothetical protein